MIFQRSGSLTDAPVNVKIKLAALWATLMFLYIYADYFRLMTPEKLEKMMQLQTPMGPTTPTLLLIFSTILIIPALMICLSVLLKSRLNKWLNLVVALLYALISVMIITSAYSDAWQSFFVLFNVIELIVLVLIMVQAWTWPRTNRRNPQI